MVDLLRVVTNSGHFRDATGVEHVQAVLRAFHGDKPEVSTCAVPPCSALLTSRLRRSQQPTSALETASAAFSFFADCMQHVPTLAGATTYLSLLGDVCEWAKRAVGEEDADEAAELRIGLSKRARKLLERHWGV